MRIAAGHVTTNTRLPGLGFFPAPSPLNVGIWYKIRYKRECERPAFRKNVVIPLSGEPTQEKGKR